MKNIHVLPTDKPSRFYFNNNDKCFQLCKFDKKSTPLKINQNIYITSDEEIKEGDYFYQDFDSIIHKCYKLTDNYVIADKPSDYPKRICKKIILTTDQELIKDGIQDIDDEFLEWFVKNPSCESVETHIVKLCTNCGQQFCDNRYCLGYKDEPEYLISFPENTIKQIITYCKGYEISRENIIIPKEEPKPIHEQIIEVCGGEEKFKEIVGLKPKQETLEEVAERWNEKQYPLEFGKPYNAPNRIKAFIEGAKWEQEQDKNKYSEEEVKLIEYIQWVIRKIDAGNTPEEIVRLLLFNRDKIEQFKKK